MIDRYFYSNIQ